MNEPVRNQVTLDKGEISILSAGPQAGTPVVCIHGIPTGAELWRDVITRLGNAGYRAYAPDMPGYGQTRLKIGGDYSLRGAAELIASWMQSEDIAPAALVGHDIGGGVQQILTVRYPELVDQLVFSNSVVGDSWPVPPIRLLQWIARLRLFPLLAATGLHHFEPYLNEQLKRTFANPWLAKNKDFRQRIFFDSKMVTPEGRHAFAAHLRSLDPVQTAAVEAGLDEIDVPVYFLWGREDPFLAFEGPGERLKQHFDLFQVKILDRAGHFVMLDTPEAYADALIAWLDAETINGSDLLA